MNRTLPVICGILLIVASLGLLAAAQTPSTQQAAPASPNATGQAPQPIPVMDGEAGPCTLELTVTTGHGTPVYAAIIRVHLAYGFAGIRKLDLQAGTNWEGKVKFVGLPSKIRGAPAEFRATKDQLTGIALFEPELECQGRHDIFMDTPKAETKK
jgi:hypothetical protein